MFKNSFSFQGRIGRTEFGLSYALALICIYALVFIVDWLEINGLPILIHLTAIYWFLFAQGAKRCHDMGNSGFYQLIPFYIFAMVFSKGENRRNKYGQDPKLVELQERESAFSGKNKGISFPEGKSLESVGSELLSGIMLTVLTVALISYFYGKNGWPYYTIECLVIMAGYYLVLLFGFKPEKAAGSINYFLLHRAVFSIVSYVCIWGYEVYSNNITDLNFSAVGGDISYILAIFTLTYIPYLIFKSKKSPRPIPLEA